MVFNINVADRQFVCFRSLPKYEASHEFQTKKKRQQQRQQQEEQAKRMKVQHHPAPHTRLPPIQQQPLRPGSHQPGHNLGAPVHANGVPNQHNNNYNNRYCVLTTKKNLLLVFYSRLPQAFTCTFLVGGVMLVIR